MIDAHFSKDFNRCDQEVGHPRQFSDSLYNKFVALNNLVIINSSFATREPRKLDNVAFPEILSQIAFI